MGYLDEIRHRGRDANPFLRLMGIEIDRYGEGEAQLSMEVRPDMLNLAGWLQGGILTSLSDEAMALALFSAVEDGVSIATISETTSYLQAVRDGKVTAVGRVIRRGNRVAFTEGCVMRSDDDSLLSRTTASFIVMPAASLGSKAG